MKKSEAKTATKRVNAMSKKISKNERGGVVSSAWKPYTRNDIEAILTNVLMVSVGIAALLLTLSIFITVVRN